jgi:hypothetical protein
MKSIHLDALTAVLGLVLLAVVISAFLMIVNPIH